MPARTTGETPALRAGRRRYECEYEGQDLESCPHIHCLRRVKGWAVEKLALTDQQLAISTAGQGYRSRQKRKGSVGRVLISKSPARSGVFKKGRLAQLVRARASHARGHRFESYSAHHRAVPFYLRLRKRFLQMVSWRRNRAIKRLR